MLAVAAALVITFSPGNGGAARRSTLHCPSASPACKRLARLDDPFAPVPKGSACTQIYGGPQTARVVGSFRGHSVWVRFRRRNGCEIARWNRVRFLFP